MPILIERPTSSPRLRTLAPYPSSTDQSQLSEFSRPPQLSSQQPMATPTLSTASSSSNLSLGAMSQLLDSHLSQILGGLYRADGSNGSVGTSPGTPSTGIPLSSSLLSTLSSILASSSTHNTQASPRQSHPLGEAQLMHGSGWL